MQFSSRQIELACQLKDAGLSWNPAPGQYAYDRKHRIKPGSPFQDRVYFFLDFPCFVQYFGSAARLRDSMVWLPTWEEAAQRLREAQVDLPTLLSDRTLKEQAELEAAYLSLLNVIRDRT